MQCMSLPPEMHALASCFVLIMKHLNFLQVIKVNHEAHGVDTPEDVAKIESLMRERNIC